MHGLFDDFRFALRSFRKTPGFTFIAALTLALGIGANAAIFSVVDAVLLRPLPYAEPEQLVTILHRGTDPVAFANYADWRDQSRSFSAMEAAEYWTVNFTGSGEPQHLWALHVTDGMFRLLGVQPLLGRWFLPGEEIEGQDHVAVIGYSLWQRQFAGNPGAVGSTVQLDGARYTVVGVMPRDFRFAPFWATKAEVWAPMTTAKRVHDRDGESLRVFARLKPSVTLEQARAEIATITSRLEAQFPGTNRDVVVTPLRDNVVGNVRMPLLILIAAAGFVLLIACANLTNMMLARATVRQKEAAVRAALGASRSRLVQHSLAEALALAGLGSGGGLLIARFGTRALLALAPAELPGAQNVGLDANVLLFMFALAVLAAISFGIAPALRAGARSLSEALKQGSRGDSEGRTQGRLRALLVGTEFALALMLLVGAGLMLRSFVGLRAIDSGFDPHHVLSMMVSVKGTSEAPAARREVFYRELVAKVRTLPAVEAASGINHLPLAGDTWGFPYQLEGRPRPRPGERQSAIYRIAMPGYFHTMRIPVLRGREIAEGDTKESPKVVVVNEAFVRRNFSSGENPLGKRLAFGDPEKGAPSYSIVGVIKDTKQENWSAPVEPETYIAALQDADFLGDPGSHISYITLVARLSGDPAQAAGEMKEAVWSFDRNLPISEVLTMDKVVAEANAQPRFELTLLALFASLAVMLAAAGIFGVMSYAVSRRTREIGIRMSLGAGTTEVLRMVLGRALLVSSVGAMAGVAGALLLSGVMRSLLYGIKPADPPTIAAAGVAVIAIGVAASYIPARAATRIDPIAALRQD